MPDLFFDTETTGLPDYSLPVDHPKQPHIVQLAAILIDDGGIERASLSVIIKPEGWTIPEGAAAVHGISTELATAVGIEIRAAIGVFLRLRRVASVLVAHNIKFDDFLIETSTRRTFGVLIPGWQGERFCTMEAAAPIVDLPATDRMKAAGFNKPKPPKLSEAYRHFFSEELEGAHDALVDVRACRRIYDHLKEIGKAAQE
ncbi:3'-5' exonuclease [Elstera cyanobacteriorum]|uniref:3'-5' exonuclease n=1 Tax=Elstera cyanobacteriorum TaxID=2022747 RepID=UPI002356E131|nr:3'-5' exonuclease [Elstera cyanobacteriorum]MCK6442321.1 3'-5' exonuclease [Elstera cyanobacteriorum]